MPGKVARSARYLGPWLHMRGAVCCEREKRIVAARMGFSALGQYWWSKTQWPMKRLVFMGRVAGATASGLEALLPSKGDYDIFNKVVLGLLRKMLAGRARAQVTRLQGEAGEEEVVFRKTSSAEVWEEAKLVLIEREMLVRRLGQYRKWATEPANHAHVLAAIFGQSRCEDMPTVDDSGRFMPGANPWAKSVWEDLQQLESLEEGRYLLEQVGGSVLQVFRCEDVRQQFEAIDLRQLGGQARRCEVPPPGYQLTSRSRSRSRSRSERGGQESMSATTRGEEGQSACSASRPIGHWSHMPSRHTRSSSTCAG